MEWKKDLFFVLSAELAAMFLAAETVFRALTFPGMMFNTAFIRICIYTLSISLFLGWLFSLFPEKTAKILTCITGIFFGA